MTYRFPTGVFASCLRPITQAALVLAVALVPLPALAQSASDKSTARQLAVDGINLFKAAKYGDALERLQRAEQLYDAHVHLVYIARCQARLGRLVEAAESYRALARKPLAPDAAEVVKSAKTEGANELTQLEPRIPMLRIDTDPKDPPGVEMSINGEAVSSAAIGIDRPVNPGKLVIRVGGAGWKTAEQTLDIAEAQKRSLTIKLEAGEGGPPVVEGGAKTPTGAVVPPPSPAKDRGPITLGIVLGLRLGVTAPFGRLDGTWKWASADGGKQVQSSNIGDLIDAGGSLDARLGFRFLENFTGLAVGQVTSFHPRPSSAGGAQFDDLALAAYKNSAGEATSLPFGFQAGLGFMYSRSNGRLGWFGEVDFVLQRIKSSTKVTTAQAQNDCIADIELSGGAVRFSGGAVLPVARFLELHPFGGLSLGRLSNGTISGSCNSTVQSDVAGVQAALTLGVGGDLLIGLDKR